MKLATCEYKNDKVLVVVDSEWDQPEQGKVLLLSGQPDWPTDIYTMQLVIENYSSLSGVIDNIVSRATSGQWLPVSQVRLRAPIPEPARNIICLGWNYAEHAIESSAAKDIHIADLPQYPIVFTKATTTVNGPYDPVDDDPRVSRRLDWEVELGVVIGKKGRHIPESEAWKHIFGYMVINDISARDLQKRHQQFFMGKSIDGTCPMGPWIVTADEISNAQNLDLRCKVNGVIKQDGNTNQQIFNIATTISTLSRVMTLVPGDIIATGTPSGVGFARTPPEYLQVGDVVECEVEKIGRICNAIVNIEARR